MILVVGATGMVGGEICRRFVGREEPVRALVRSTSDPAKVKALDELGITTVVGDLRDRASLLEACRGVDAVVTTASAMPFAYRPGENDIRTTDLEGTLNLIGAAREAGVPRFVYTSFSSQIDLDFPLRNAKRTIEARLVESGLDYTILRPSFFMEVWLSPAFGFDPEAGKASIYGTGERPISWISIHDVATFAVHSLEAPIAHRAILELGGPLPLTPLQVVGIFERASRRTFALEHVPEEALRTRQEAAADPMEQSATALMRCYARGDPIEMGKTLEAFNVTLTTVQEYAEHVLGKVPLHAR